jgi:hypothetical protein
VQQPVPAGVDQRVTDVPFAAVQREEHSLVRAVVLLPPAGVGDRLVLVLVAEVVHRVVGHGDREPVGTRGRRKAARHRPRPQHAAFLQAQVEVMPGPPVLVQHERRMLLVHPVHPLNDAKSSWRIPVFTPSKPSFRGLDRLQKKAHGGES